MTQGSSSSSDGGDSSNTAVQVQHCTVDIRDRTAELHRAMNNHTPNENVRVVTDENGVPVTDETHFRPIQNDGREPSTSDSYSVTLPIKPQPKQHKANCKPKQLSKKEKKELQKAQGVPEPAYPGQKPNPTRKEQPLEMVEIREGAVANQDKLYVMEAFPTVEEDRTGIRDGTMHVKATNEAAQAFLGTSAPVPMPFYRDAKDMGKEMTFTDTHKDSQMKYCRYVNTIGNYTGLPAGVKPLHRMGFGIAASGIRDTEPLVLSFFGAKPFMKHNFSDYVAVSGTKGGIQNWRQDYITQHQTEKMGYATRKAGEAMSDLSKVKDEFINNISHAFIKATLEAIDAADLRALLLYYGEMERVILRNRDREDQMAGGARSSRIAMLTEEVLQWSTGMFVEKMEDGSTTPRRFNLLMALASRLPGEQECSEMGHKKCTMIHFLTTRTDYQIHLNHRCTDGNTALHYAAMSGAPCQINALLMSNAPLNVLNESYRSPLALAMRRKTTLQARQLMWLGGNIDGAMSLANYHPKSLKDNDSWEASIYADRCEIGKTPPAAYEWITKRYRALCNTYVSWVDALLGNADARMPLAFHGVNSGLHQIRIGPCVSDELTETNGRVQVTKTFTMLMERSKIPDHPIHICFIPCQYNKEDTTMPAHFPHIVRVPMLTSSIETAQEINKLEEARKEVHGGRADYKEKIQKMRPLKLFSAKPIVTFGDCKTSHSAALETSFANEHNGVYYIYDLPHSVTDCGRQTVITVSITIPQREAQLLSNAFFMVQCIQLMPRATDKPLFPLPADPSTACQDERAEEMSEEMIRRKQVMDAERLAQEAKDELIERRRAALSNDIVLTAQRRRDELEAREARERYLQEQAVTKSEPSTGPAKENQEPPKKEEKKKTPHGKKAKND